MLKAPRRRPIHPAEGTQVCPGSPYGPLGSNEERAAFAGLQEQLPRVWQATRMSHSPHTSVFVPSLSVNQEELAKVQGASFYEERFLFSLIRLRNPAARLIYLTSQPIHPDVIGYYLQLLPGVPAGHAMGRLLMLCMYDASDRPLTLKVLERPRVLERLRRWIGDPARAYLSCYNVTVLERRLAVELGIPLNGVDPELLWLGTKSGSRRVFEAAGVLHPSGANDLHTPRHVVRALSTLTVERPSMRRAVVKLNEGFSGEGNGLFTCPDGLRAGGAQDGDPDARVLAALKRLEWPTAKETYRDFLRKMREMGGVVEEFIEAGETRSPSAQMRILPGGELTVVSTHDQVLGGATGQVYLGCRFPASDEYRVEIQAAAFRIGEVLREHGVLGRFGIDFLTTRDGAGPWAIHAIEINLRMGGTTPPFLALEFLTGGGLDPRTGLYRSETDQTKYYFATDNLKSPAYRGLLPEDFVALLTQHGVHFRHGTGTGVVFYMIGALSQYGKLGVTSIGNSREEADQLYESAVAILDRETGADAASHGTPQPLFETLAVNR